MRTLAWLAPLIPAGLKLHCGVGGSKTHVASPCGRRGSKGPAGSISLRLRFLPFDGVLADEAAPGQMGGPVLGSPPSAILTSQWRDLQASRPSVAPAAPPHHGCLWRHRVSTIQPAP